MPQNASSGTKSRLRCSLMSLCDQMRQIRHLPIQEQVDALNLTLRGHYAYYGAAGNIRALQRVHRFVELAQDAL